MSCIKLSVVVNVVCMEQLRSISYALSDGNENHNVEETLNPA
jgi:hypothetical protein